MYQLESIPVNECFAVTCDKCGKTTWKVGLHSILRLIIDSIGGRDAVPTLTQ